MESAQIPCVNLGPLLTEKEVDSEEIQSTLSALGKAAEGWGTFYVSNHGVDPSTIQKAHEEAMDFFGQGEEIKKSVAKNGDEVQGYSDHRYRKNDGHKTSGYKESLELFSQCYDGLGDNSPNATNKWPPLPNFQPAIEEYFQALRNVNKTVMKGLFLALDMQLQDVNEHMKVSFSNKEDFDTCCMKLHHYPKGGGEGSFGIGAHTDTGVLVTLYQEEGVTSLQVLKGETWHDIPPKSGTLVVNVGEMTKVWSNDKYHSPLHRVQSSPERSRLSITCLLNPSYNAEVQPILRPGEVKNYETINWLDFRRKKDSAHGAGAGHKSVDPKIGDYLVRP